MSRFNWFGLRNRTHRPAAGASAGGIDLHAVAGVLREFRTERQAQAASPYPTTLQGLATEVVAAIEMRRAAGHPDPFSQPVVIARRGADAEALRNLIAPLQTQLESAHGWRVEFRSDWFGGPPGTPGHTVEYTLDIGPDRRIPSTLEPLVSEYVDALMDRPSSQSADDRFVEVRRERVDPLFGYYATLRHGQALSIAHELVTGDDPRQGFSLHDPDAGVTVIENLKDRIREMDSGD